MVENLGLAATTRAHPTVLDCEQKNNVSLRTMFYRTESNELVREKGDKGDKGDKLDMCLPRRQPRRQRFWWLYTDEQRPGLALSSAESVERDNIRCP